MFFTTSSGVFAIISFIVGFSLYYWISRRRFNRRNMAENKKFKSYEQSVLVKFLEKTGKLIAYILIIIGIFLSIVAYSTKTTEPEKNNSTQIEQNN